MQAIIVFVFVFMPMLFGYAFIFLRLLFGMELCW